jgi:alpha-glucosidase
MRAVLDEYDDRMMVGEIYLPVEQLMTYYGDGDECHMPFNFQLINCPGTQPSATGPLRRPPCRGRLAQLGAGQPRPAPHRHPRRPGAGPRGPDAAADAARHADLLLRRRDRHGGRAHPLEECMDPAALQQPEIAHISGRDPERTPMQWDVPGAQRRPFT